MFAQERQQAILAALQTRSPLTVQALEKLLQASPATVRRDLTFLEGLGRIARTHGGVMRADQAGRELPFDRKSRAALRAKATMAQAARSLVKPGQTVFVDAGSTTLPVGKALLAHENLTLFTNSIPLLAERPSAGTRLIALGGEVRHVSLALVGAEAMEWVRRVRIDVAFLGASGIDREGVTTTELSEAQIKSAIVAKADRVAVLADASKWDRPAAIRYADWTQVHHLFTDHAFTREERQGIVAQGTRIHPVEK